MKIAVSACLLGENCKYNGGNNNCEKLHRFLEGHEVISVCPEVLGGLPTPRIPAEIVCGTVMNWAGENVDTPFRRGAQAALEQAKAFGTELVILQSRSPSCGIGTIYDGTFSKTLTSGNGIFAELLIQNGIPVMDVAEIKEKE